MTSKQKIHLLYFATVVFSSIVVVIVSTGTDILPGYEQLWILPLAFLMASIFNTKIMNQLTSNLVISIIWGGYFIRFVITPLFLSLGNYRTVFNHLNYNHITNAIFLMLYEIVVVSLVLNFYISRTLVKRSKKIVSSMQVVRHRILERRIVLITGILITVSIFIPQIRESFTTIFSSTNTIVSIDYNISSIASRGTVTRMVVSLFVFIFEIMRYVIPAYLIKMVYRIFSSRRVSLVINSIISVLPFLFITGSSIQPFISLLINIIMMKKLYPKKINKLIIIYFIIGFSGLYIILGSKSGILGAASGANGISNISLTLNAYFPGIDNVAASLNIPRENRLTTLIYDLFSTIPFRFSLFPRISSSEVTLSNLFALHSGQKNHILPLIGGSYFYLGFIIAPLIPAAISCLSIYLYQRTRYTNDYWIYFFLVIFSVKVGMIPTLYTHTNLLHMMLNFIIPLYLILGIRILRVHKVN